MELFLCKTTLFVFCPSFTPQDQWLKSLWEKPELDSQNHQLQETGKQDGVSREHRQLLGAFWKGLYCGYSFVPASAAFDKALNSSKMGNGLICPVQQSGTSMTSLGHQDLGGSACRNRDKEEQARTPAPPTMTKGLHGTGLRELLVSWEKKKKDLFYHFKNTN